MGDPHVVLELGRPPPLVTPKNKQPCDARPKTLGFFIEDKGGGEGVRFRAPQTFKKKEK